MRFTVLACLAATVLGFPFAAEEEALAGAPAFIEGPELDDRDATMHSTLLQERASPPTTYKEIAIFAHNLHRSNHSAPDVTWSKDLHNDAKIIAEKCVFAHNV